MVTLEYSHTGTTRSTTTHARTGDLIFSRFGHFYILDSLNILAIIDILDISDILYILHILYILYALHISDLLDIFDFAGVFEI
jgi:hypothetical protein